MPRRENGSDYGRYISSGDERDDRSRSDRGPAKRRRDDDLPPQCRRDSVTPPPRQSAPRDKLEDMLDRKFAEQRKEIKKTVKETIDTRLAKRLEQNTKHMKAWVLEEREPDMKKYVQQEIGAVAMHVATMRSALLQRCRENNTSVTVLCSVSKTMFEDDKKKLVTRALDGTDKETLKVEMKDGDQYVRIHFQNARLLV